LTVKAILHIFVELGKLEDVGEALAKYLKSSTSTRSPESTT